MTKTEVQKIVEEYRKTPDDQLFATVLETVKRNKESFVKQLEKNKDFHVGKNDDSYQKILDYLNKNRQLVLDHLRKTSIV